MIFFYHFLLNYFSSEVITPFKEIFGQTAMDMDSYEKIFIQFLHELIFLFIAIVVKVLKLVMDTSPVKIYV